MDPLAERLPLQIGGFTLSRPLGVAPTGRIYLGLDADGREAAVTVVHPWLAEDPGFVERLRQDLAAMAGLRSGHLAELVASGPDDPRPWFATARPAGPTLVELIGTRGPLPAERVLEIAAAVARALTELHAAGLVHGDLRPANVVLTPAGPRLVAPDLGRSSARGRAGGLPPGAAGIDAPPITPEQAAGGPAAATADVFGLGVTAYYAATGLHVFGTALQRDRVYRVLHAEPDLLPLRDWTVHALVLACLAKNPADRPAAADVAAAIADRQPAERAAGGAGPAVAGEVAAGSVAAVPAVPAVRRRWPPALVASLTLAMLAAAGGGAAVLFRGGTAPVAAAVRVPGTPEMAAAAPSAAPAPATGLAPAAAVALAAPGPLRATVYFGQLGSLLPEVGAGGLPTGGNRAAHPSRCALAVVFGGVRGSRAAVLPAGLGPGWTPLEGTEGTEGTARDGRVGQLLVPPADVAAGRQFHARAVLRVGGAASRPLGYRLELVARDGDRLTWRLGAAEVGCTLT